MHLAPSEGRPTWERAEPAHQSGLDVVPNSKLSPRSNESTQGRLFPFRCPSAQEERINYGESFSLLCRFRLAQGIRGSLCAKNGTERPPTPTDTPLGNHDTRHSDDGGLDGGARSHPRSHGVHWSVLEAHLQHPGEPFHRAACECQTSKTGARTQE